MTIASSTTLPRPGMIATVRNRRGIITAVRPYAHNTGDQLHLVEIAFGDGHQPVEDCLIWEREPHARLAAPGALPDLDNSEAMSPEDLLPIIRACRWMARTPYVDPDGAGPLSRHPITSPFHGAVQVEDYQMVPLLKALRMPRVSLLIADDVGLGKTVETALILQELLLRRRIRRVLILTPASLREQWQDELWGKFSLSFDLVDRQNTDKLRREMGLDANPWRSSARVITSYHYLKQPDVLESFMAASKRREGQANLPWDLLIVDEAHNLTPAPMGEESDLVKMLRLVAPLCEHKLFLTATPHNGHTRSFTGLLELLDPVRFTQTNETMSPSEKKRIEDVLVRRLKREINEASATPRFCERLEPKALELNLSPAEKALHGAFEDLRAHLTKLVAQTSKQTQRTGRFAIEILGKRLLSGPVAFAESWRRAMEGLQQAEAATEAEVAATERATQEDLSDDAESEGRLATAATTVGSWLRPHAKALQTEIQAIDAALTTLHLKLTRDSLVETIRPKQDSRFTALTHLIDTHLREGNAWKTDERLIVFTEYKTTLDSLVARLREKYPPESIRFLYGGMERTTRLDIQQAFNDPADAVRVLIATDAASEGLNLQRTARYLLHWDVPWNPSRVEQRNGRLDRHGQARDVQTWHFLSNESEDMKFLDLFLRKIDTMREDLGAVGEIFDEAAHRRLVEGRPVKEVATLLETATEARRSQIAVDRDKTAVASEGARTEDLEAIARALDLSPESLRDTLDAAMGLRVGRPRLTDPDDKGRSTLKQPHPPAWTDTIDDHLRQRSRQSQLGALQAIAFDPSRFIDNVGGKPVFRPRLDTVLMHLGHPAMHRATASLNRLRFRGDGGASCWTCGIGAVPPKATAMLRLTVEELAINPLRETFHHWVHTVEFPVESAKLKNALAARPANELPALRKAPAACVKQARDLWLDLEDDVKAWLKQYADSLTQKLQSQVDTDRSRARDEAVSNFNSRQGEVSKLIQGNTMDRLEREIAEMRAKQKEATNLLFGADTDLIQSLERDVVAKEEELKRRASHYNQIRKQLEEERERVLKQLIPRRFALEGSAQVHPIALEFVFSA